VDLAALNGEVEPFDYLLAFDADVKAIDDEQRCVLGHAYPRSIAPAGPIGRPSDSL
jgi:hypothetical protein